MPSLPLRFCQTHTITSETFVHLVKEVLSPFTVLYFEEKQWASRNSVFPLGNLKYRVFTSITSTIFLLVSLFYGSSMYEWGEWTLRLIYCWLETGTFSSFQYLGFLRSFQITYVLSLAIYLPTYKFWFTKPARFSGFKSYFFCMIFSEVEHSNVSHAKRTESTLSVG